MATKAEKVAEIERQYKEALDSAEDDAADSEDEDDDDKDDMVITLRGQAKEKMLSALAALKGDGKEEEEDKGKPPKTAKEKTAPPVTDGKPPESHRYFTKKSG